MLRYLAPHHPSSERAVKTFKEGMKKCISSSSESIECCLSRVLFQYRITPHSTTGVSQSQLLFERRIQSLNSTRHVEAKQMAQKKNHNRHSRDRVFQIGDLVFIKKTLEMDCPGYQVKLNRFKAHCHILFC